MTEAGGWRDVNGQGAEIKIKGGRDGYLPWEPGVYFSICKFWLHYPEFNRSEMSRRRAKVKLISQPMGRKGEKWAQMMSFARPICLSSSPPSPSSLPSSDGD